MINKKIVFIIIAVLVLVGAMSYVFLKPDKNENNNLFKDRMASPSENSQKEEVKNDDAGIGNVCAYFSKEVVEAAIGRPVVKTETPIIGIENCYYYTSYSETYDHTPYGDKPGGAHVVAIYDAKDFAKDRVYNESHGTTYKIDASIPMDNFVMVNTAGKIWHVALSLGDEKYIRFRSVDDAVTGDELIKIAAKFAERIKSGN